MKPRGGEGQNGRLKCPMGFLVLFKFEIYLKTKKVSLSCLPSTNKKTLYNKVFQKYIMSKDETIHLLDHDSV